jgi:hypothetical protein
MRNFTVQQFVTAANVVIEPSERERDGHGRACASHSLVRGSGRASGGT